MASSFCPLFLLQRCNYMIQLNPRVNNPAVGTFYVLLSAVFFQPWRLYDQNRSMAVSVCQRRTKHLRPDHTAALHEADPSSFSTEPIRYFRRHLLSFHEHHICLCHQNDIRRQCHHPAIHTSGFSDSYPLDLLS